MNVQGSCLCGAVAFEVKDAPVLMNALCHCRACSIARGMSPVHLIGVPADSLRITKGEDSLKVGPGRGTMTHGFCSICGGGVFQCPKDAAFKAIFPSTLHINTNADDKSCLLPADLHPTCHVNYENRMLDAHDTLPKYLVWRSGVQVDNAGFPIDDTN